MKISLKLASGATLEFEGDGEEFERISAFLSNPPPALTASAPVSAQAVIPAGVQHGDLGGEGLGEEVPPLDARNVATRLEGVGARSDMERVTVMAQLAVEAGEDGLDYGTVGRLYTELGFRKPPRFPKTFSNAKTAGLLRSVKYGLWRPTVKGENYALGHGRPKDGGARRASAPSRTNDDAVGGDDD